MPLDPSQILLLWAGVIFASVLRAFTGFGFALAVVPVFAMFLAPAEVVVLAASLSLVLGMVSVRTWWGLFSLREILPLITPGMGGYCAWCLPADWNVSR
jgi:uncharacterized membrane protein YfcA